MQLITSSYFFPTHPSPARPLDPAVAVAVPSPFVGAEVAYVVVSVPSNGPRSCPRGSRSHSPRPSRNESACRFARRAAMSCLRRWISCRRASFWSSRVRR